MTPHSTIHAPPVYESPGDVVSGRFTLDGSDELEAHLDHICQRVLLGVLQVVPEKKVEAIVLGGGYGRGEGGVWRTSVGDRPYNDMEFYVFMHGVPRLNERRHAEALHELARQLSFEAGVEVEFKISSLGSLRRSPTNMFHYDLVMGHRWLLGDESLLKGCEHHRNAGAIPLHEATRLLMNRCSGLLFVREQLPYGLVAVDQVDFIGRNLAKAQLALGDVLLTVYGHYHWSCRERHQRLQGFVSSRDLPWVEEVRLHHVEGLEFKLHPQKNRAGHEELMALHADLTALALRLWLWLENRRLGQNFISAADYALSPVNKCPETNAWKNRLLNAWHFGPDKLFLPQSSRYPRERVLQSLALLLWEPNLMTDARLLPRTQEQLDTYATSYTNLITAYRSIWRTFN